MIHSVLGNALQRAAGTAIRVVIDTSVLVRYLIKPSAAIQELIDDRWLMDEIQMVTSPELVAELESVVKRDALQRFIRLKESRAFLDAIRWKAEFLPALGLIPSYTRDPKDDKFVACALAGKVEYLISVDNDILALRSLDSVRMVSPYTFIQMTREKGYLS